MSRHNRVRRYNGDGTKTAKQRFVRRIVISQTYERDSPADNWTLAHVNMDCGGMIEGDAAKLVYSVAIKLMNKLAKDSEAKTALFKEVTDGEATDLQQVRPADTGGQDRGTAGDGDVPAVQ